MVRGPFLVIFLTFYVSYMFIFSYISYKFLPCAFGYYNVTRKVSHFKQNLIILCIRFELNIECYSKKYHILSKIFFK